MTRSREEHGTVVISDFSVFYCLICKNNLTWTVLTEITILKQKERHITVNSQNKLCSVTKHRLSCWLLTHTNKVSRFKSSTQHYISWLDVKFIWNNIIHIWTTVVDESEEWSSQLIFQFKQYCKEEAWKKSGLQQDLNPWTLRYPGGHGLESHLKP